MTASTLVKKRVRWTSQSSGSTTTKEGVVVYDGPRLRRVTTFTPSHWRSRVDFHLFLDSTPSRDRTGGRHSINTGILVLVTPSARSLPRFYSPYRDRLTVISEGPID